MTTYELPNKSLRAVLEGTDLECIKNELKYWLYMALSHDNSVYDFADRRKGLIEFYDHFLPLVEATHTMEESEINKFRTHYPLDYVRAELWELFKAASSYDGPFTTNVSKINMPEFYRDMVRIAEAAYLMSDQSLL